MTFVTKDFVRSYVRRAQSLDVILPVHCSFALLYVRHGYSSLSFFMRDELVLAIFHLSISQMCIVFFSFFLMYLVYGFYLAAWNADAV